MKTKHPNIILIVMDAARADHLSCYGYGRPTTPNLDRIAREGTLYENAISAAVWTVPSHASLFTGLYPSAHGLDGRNLKLRPDVPTLAAFLQGLGYETAAFTANALVGKATGLARGFQECKDIRDLVQSEERAGWRQRVNGLYRRLYYGPHPHQGTWYDNGAWRLNYEVKRWLHNWQGQGTKRPFFIFANYMETHLRYEPPRAYRQQFLTPAQQKRWRQINQNAWKFMSGDIAMDAEDWQLLTALYDAELAYLDMRLGQLYDFLQLRGLLDNTIFIITADHGENLGDHNLMDHQYCVYDTLAKVPLIIRYPERFPAGGRMAELVQSVDLFPTLATMAAGALPDLFTLQGQSLLSETLPETGRDFAIIEYLAPQLHSFGREAVEVDGYFGRKLRAIRTHDHKYIWASDGRHELYNLHTDPGETQNVIELEWETAAALARCLEQWLHSFAHTSFEDDSIDETIVQHLEALGYLEIRN
jgi:arylsulfatase A-like enzyme